MDRYFSYEIFLDQRNVEWNELNKTLFTQKDVDWEKPKTLFTQKDVDWEKPKTLFTQKDVRRKENGRSKFE